MDQGVGDDASSNNSSEADLDLDDNFAELLKAAKKKERDKLKLVRERARGFELVEGDPMQLRRLPPELRGDKDIVLAAVKRRGAALKFAREHLRNESKIVLAAVAQDGLAWRYASATLRGHRPTELDDLGGLGPNPDYGVEAARKIAAVAVRQNPSAFKFASAELRSERSLVASAVKRDWRALKRVPRPKFEKVPMPAPHSRAHGPTTNQLSAFAMYWAALKLQRAIRARQRQAGPSAAWVTARSTIACVVKLQRCVRQHMRQVGPSEARLMQRRESAAAKCLQGHTRVRQAAQHKAARLVQHHARKHLHHKHTPLEYDVRNDRSVVGFAVAQNADALGEASRDLRSDKPLVMAAVTSDGLALRFASVLLRCDREVVLAAATQNGCALAFATKALRGDHEVAHAAILSGRGAPECLAHVDPKLRDNLPFMLDACRQHGGSLKWASPVLQANRELVLVATAQDPTAMRYASEHIVFEDDHDDDDDAHHKHHSDKSPHHGHSRSHKSHGGYSNKSGHHHEHRHVHKSHGLES